MSIEKILEEMENLLLDAPRVPLTNKRVVEEDDLARLIDELREEFPGEIMEATRIMQDRQHITSSLHNFTRIDSIFWKMHKSKRRILLTRLKVILQS
jgi:hypothetical protein